MSVRSDGYYPAGLFRRRGLPVRLEHETVELGGQVQPVKVAHLRLCHSRVFLAVAYLREAQEMVFDAHWRAFQLWGGVPRRGIYDNLKTAVNLIFASKQRQYNRRFVQMTSHS